MKFSSREEIAAPSDFVFARLSDFDMLADAARARGAEILRLDARQTPGVGQSWQAGFRWRGRQRRLLVDLVAYDPPARLGFLAESQAYQISLGLGLQDLARGRSRLLVELEVRPRSLAARIMLQSLKLGKARLQARFEQRLRLGADLLEERWRADQARSGSAG